VAWTEAAQLASLAEMLGKSDKRFLLRNSRSATLADLRNGPVIWAVAGQFVVDALCFKASLPPAHGRCQSEDVD